MVYQDLEIYKSVHKLAVEISRMSFKFSSKNRINNLRPRVKKSFTLLEIMVALVVFAMITMSIGGVFVFVQKTWQKQRDIIDLVQNARWAMEFMSNEVREAGNTSISIYGSGNELKFDIDPDNDGSPPFRTIDYQKNGTILRRRWKQGADRHAWEDLANFVVSNPDGNDIFTINDNLITIELTVEKNGRQYTLKTEVRARN